MSQTAADSGSGPRAVRRRDRQIGADDCRQILERGDYASLATVDPDGQPYVVPLSYVFWQERLYFHCAREGRKIDDFRADPRVGLTVVGRAAPVYDHGYSTYYESVFVWGRVREVEAAEERRTALSELCRKYLPDDLDKFADNLEHLDSRTAVYAVEITAMTGKAKRPR